MLQKPMFIAMLLLCMAGTAHAQDKIYKRNGDIINAKIRKVATDITYVRYDNLTGPEYTISKDDVSRIKYENGTEDVFEEDDYRSNLPWFFPRNLPMKHPRFPRIHDSTKYRRNVLALAPFAFSENGVGLSLSYERSLDRNGVLTLYIPVALTFNLNNGTYMTPTGSEENGHRDRMFYFSPGVKIYPAGYRGKVRYALGASLVYGTGEKSQLEYLSSAVRYHAYNHDLFGVMISNSLNMNPTAHVYFGIDVGLGFAYFNHINGINQDNNFIAQGGIRIGYRFGKVEH